MASDQADSGISSGGRGSSATAKATDAQLAWLKTGLSQPGGKLPLFDSQGQRINAKTIRACIDHGWAEPWVANPIKPDWEVCKLTPAGRQMLAGKPARP
ncbi:hypothetical protein ACKTEK_09820 [Tepidamorphus sp. 3E244]|uniref:hypothetical protein n=1 Tax=Tepidamorphus sp. 3E244 TaxID=3385498 RepID=UPI0038FC9741